MVELHDVSDAPLGCTWPMVVQDVEVAASFSDGELDPEDVRRAVEAGAAQLWLVFSDGAYRGVVVTEIQRRMVNLVLIRLRDHARLGAVLEWLRRWAVDEIGPGVKLCGSSRRPGMGRLLARLGWKPRFIEYVSP